MAEEVQPFTSWPQVAPCLLSEKGLHQDNYGMELLLTLIRESIQVQATILSLPSWAISTNFMIFTKSIGFGNSV